MLQEAVESFKFAVQYSGVDQSFLVALENACSLTKISHKDFWASGLPGREPYFWAGLGFAYGRLGKKCEAQEIVVQLETAARQRYISPYAIALVYVGLGSNETNNALNWLEHADRVKDPGLDLLRIEPAFDQLRQSHDSRA